MLTRDRHRDGRGRAVPDARWRRCCLRGEALFVLPSQHDALLLLALAMGCTLLPFALSLVALRQLSAFSTALAVNMEPVYAIVLAIVLLGEQRELSLSFYSRRRDHPGRRVPASLDSA